MERDKLIADTQAKLMEGGYLSRGRGGGRFICLMFLLCFAPSPSHATPSSLGVCHLADDTIRLTGHVVDEHRLEIDDTRLNKVEMGETVTNVLCFEQSVSFGRFEHDSLCWERWSTFPTNKYLDEVEKCSTPGSVAQKKAYFEARYKNIAARRAELLLDQEREREAEFVNLENSASRNLVYSSSENQVGSFVGEAIVEHVPVKIDSGDVNDPSSEKEIDNEKAEMENSVNINDHWENRVGSSDDEVIVEHVPVKNGSADSDDENEVNSLNDEVTVEHVHVENDTDEVISHENEAADFPSDLSGHIDIAEHADNFKDGNELENLTNQKSELADDFSDGDVIHEVMEDIDELNDGAVVVADIGSGMIKGSDKQQQPQEEIAGENSCPALKNSELGEPKEPVAVTEDAPCVSEDLPQEKIKRTITKDKSKNLVKLASPRKLQKAALVKKTTSTTYAKNKPAATVPKRTIAPMPKSSMLSTPKSLKPDATKGSKSANRLSDKKEKGFSPLTSKKTIGPPSKRLVPTSLHMSLSLGPTKSDPASLTRRSLIMESMGDKDIVKRAFKAFRKTPEMSASSLTKSPGANQSASRKAEPKGFGPNTLPKKTEGTVRVTRTASTRIGQQVSRKTLLSPGVKNNGGGDQRNVKSVAASFGPRVQMQGNNQKVQSQVSKKLELPKSKVDKNLSQSIDSKPKLPSSTNRGLGRAVRKESGTTKMQASS